jgi:hypothetical protein
MLDFVYFPFVPLRKNISLQGVKVALDSRNNDQSPINKVVTGRRDKNPASSICASTYYSEKEPKHVAFFLVRDIFFYDTRKKYRAPPSLIPSRNGGQRRRGRREDIFRLIAGRCWAGSPSDLAWFDLAPWGAIIYTRIV